MSTVFPGAIDTFPTRVDGTDHYAAHQNDAQDAIVAIENRIGTEGNSNFISNPTGGVLPAPAWNTPPIEIGVYPNGNVVALLEWIPLTSSECVKIGRASCRERV